MQTMVQRPSLVWKASQGAPRGSVLASAREPAVVGNSRDSILTGHNRPINIAVASLRHGVAANPATNSSPATASFGRILRKCSRTPRKIQTMFITQKHWDEREVPVKALVGELFMKTAGIKEALVLLCEVMDVAGDPYGILGFSGMRRSRCDLYRIKDIDEPYNRLIHQRINSILPREYTRMGPAVRYAADALKQYEARTRLLVTITDGMFTVVDSIFAPVGAGSLKVTSDPAGALLVIALGTAAAALLYVSLAWLLRIAPVLDGLRQGVALLRRRA